MQSLYGRAANPPRRSPATTNFTEELGAGCTVPRFPIPGGRCAGGGDFVMSAVWAPRVLPNQR